MKTIIEQKSAARVVISKSATRSANFEKQFFPKMAESKRETIYQDGDAKASRESKKVLETFLTASA